MFAVIFEVTPTKEGKEKYLSIAGEIRGFLENREGFISMERFESLVHEGKLLSLSFWENEEAIEKWRNLMDHRMAQKTGKEKLFKSYRIRVAGVTRDYTPESRSQAPDDSNHALL
ncbi:antibiotic biosynthesis monooxygenase [Desulfoluna sp.]|uniref:antibiotic biosynthesis monooxygenase family protein n=1 Tax=Desulfoluna sp. TaxID=2045199 RepID=UPI00261BA7B4|nr:antibiotic biosynthesis monooxygenase [Desulfoluna sp.]